jgi:hypothetical protein
MLSSPREVDALEVDVERAYWDAADNVARQVLHDIKTFIDYLESVKKEVALASTRLSSDEALKYIGPSAEVALTGIIHAVDYLSVCRSQIQETDLVATTRSRIKLGQR